MRPSTDVTFMRVAQVYAERATCPRASVGAVLVVAGVQVSQGWNGAPRGFPHCSSVGCDLQLVHGRESCQRAVHAEHNAILNAARMGVATMGGTLYVTHAPCGRCTAVIIQAGIERVCYLSEYAGDGLRVLEKHGIQCVKLTVDCWCCKKE